MRLFNCLLLLPYILYNTEIRAQSPVVTGYIAGYRGLIDTSVVAARHLTHLNYAFLNIRDGQVVIEHPAVDTANFQRLSGLKARNPNLKILAAVGGWSWSNNFSDAALTDSSRQRFASSAMAILRQWHLDGLDIDWEYPGMRGDGNVFRPADRDNYTLLLRDLRTAMNQLSRETGIHYQLTTAVGAFSEFIQKTAMKEVQRYVDYIHLMTYDYGNGRSGHHTNLYASQNDAAGNSADKAVRNFIAAGVPASKLVLGIAFYGKTGIVDSALNNGWNRQYVSRAYAGGYGFICDSILSNPGFLYYWDNQAKAPYLFNSSTRQFITYDDERSVMEKCRYAKKEKLAGVFFWEYLEDPAGNLLRSINNTLHAPANSGSY